MEAASADVGNRKRIEQEEPVQKKLNTGVNYEGSCSEKVVIAKTRQEERLEIFHNNIDQLIAKNSPKMSKEQQEWIEIYNKWVMDLRLRPDWGFSRAPIKFPGPRPPIPELGDPRARKRVKLRSNQHSYVVRMAEMAIQFYNKNHEGSNFEVVKVLSCNEFMYMHKWAHINFRAKPKNASAAAERCFFAEHFHDDFGDLTLRKKITEGVISTCCIMEEGSITNDDCGYCRARPEVLHPVNDGFVFNRKVTFKVSG